MQKTSASLYSLEQIKIEMEKETSKCRKEIADLTESSGKQKGVIDNLILQGEDKDQTIMRRDTSIRELETELHNTENTLKMESERYRIELQGAERRIASAEEERDQVRRRESDMQYGKD